MNNIITILQNVDEPLQYREYIEQARYEKRKKYLEQREKVVYPLYTNNNIVVLPAKLKPKMMGGKPNYTSDTEKKNPTVELNGEDMPTAKTIYFFKEEYKLI